MAEQATTEAKPRAPSINAELLKAVYRVEAKVDYGMEDVRSGLKKVSEDHEARLRVLEASDSKRQGGNTTARFLYGAVWPAVSFAIAAIGMYLQYRANHP
jgi:hypothetical protein